MARVVYSEEFRIEAVKQVTKNGYSINDTAERLGMRHILNVVSNSNT